MKLRRTYDDRDADNSTIPKVEDNKMDDLSKLVTEEDLMKAAKNSKESSVRDLHGLWERRRKKEEKEEEEGTVRIDLNGRVVSAEDDPDRLRGLHHHGQHPDKAGYTVREHNARSICISAQKATALKALAAYYERHTNDKVFDVKLIPTICMALRSDRKNRTVWSATLALTRALGLAVLRATETECEDDCFENIYLIRDDVDKELAEMLFSVQKIGFVRTCIQTLQTKEEKRSVCPLLLACSRQSLSLASSCYECVTMFTSVLRCPQNHSDEYASCVFELIRTICEAGKNLAERVCSDGVREIMLRTLAVNAQDDVLKMESLRPWRICLRYGIPLAGTYFETLVPLLCNTLVPGNSAESKRVRLGSLLILETFCRKISNWSEHPYAPSCLLLLYPWNRTMILILLPAHFTSWHRTWRIATRRIPRRNDRFETVEKYVKSSKIWQENVVSTDSFVGRTRCITCTVPFVSRLR